MPSEIFSLAKNRQGKLGRFFLILVTHNLALDSSSFPRSRLIVQREEEGLSRQITALLPRSQVDIEVRTSHV